MRGEGVRAAHLYINGAWTLPTIQPSKLHTVINPATEERIFDLQLGSATDVDAAVAAANTAFQTYSLTTREQRIELLQRVCERYAERLEDLGAAISEEMGAPEPMATFVQAECGLNHLRTFIDVLREYPFEERMGKALILREPIGVIAMITPWNWPMNQVTLKVGAALAAGCTMVLKPSEFVPTSAMIFAEILHEANVPPGVFNLVHGGPEVGSALAAHPHVQMVSFTGSTRAGIDVAIKAAPTVKRVSQELGGKSANIILDDASFADGVRRGCEQCFFNTGQSCDAPTRMLVPAARMQEAEVESAKVAASTTSNGPVVNQTQWDRIQNMILTGMREGARLVCGGSGRPEENPVGYYVKPTVFRATNQMTISREEIFGPVLVIIPYHTIDEAVSIANDTPYGLAGYVQGLDVNLAFSIARRLRCGNVAINGESEERLAPFGGYKASGNGREMASWGIDDCVEIKAIVGHERTTI